MLTQKISDKFMCNVGLKQGENMSSTLFAYYVNNTEKRLIEAGCIYLEISDDLVNSYLKLFVLLYIDDTVVLCGNEGQMQQSLLTFYDYFSAWKTKFHCSKIKIIIFSRRKTRIDNYDFNLVKKVWML